MSVVSHEELKFSLVSASTWKLDLDKTVYVNKFSRLNFHTKSQSLARVLRTYMAQLLAGQFKINFDF